MNLILYSLRYEWFDRGGSAYLRFPRRSERVATDDRGAKRVSVQFEHLLQGATEKHLFDHLNAEPAVREADHVP